MTTEITSEREKHKYCKETLEYKTDIEWRFLSLGERLHLIKEKRFFEAGWSSWEEFEMELKMSPATISKLLRIYEIFILKHSFTQRQVAEAGGWSVVAEILPAIAPDSPRTRLKELLALAGSQSRPDLRKTVLEAKSGIDMSKCKHTDSYTLRICRYCGDREIIEDTRTP